MSDNADKLIRKGQGEEGAAAQVADHLKAFWTPRMREDLARICEGEVSGLDPVALAAVCRLAAHKGDV